MLHRSLKYQFMIQDICMWFDKNHWEALSFQKDTWAAMIKGQSGMVTAPTGSGKTYSVLLGAIQYCQLKLKNPKPNGLFIIWICPIKALTKEIEISCRKAVEGLHLQWTIEVRTGDTSTAHKKKQWQKPPQILITTPESLHVLLTNTGYKTFFSRLEFIVTDEWHELLGSKRGVQVELFSAWVKTIRPKIKLWGISATVGNIQEAIDVLLYPIPKNKRTYIQAHLSKEIRIHSILPPEIDRFPWAGHIGLNLAPSVVEIIHKSKSTLIFTNTRAQCEIWYQKLLDIDPDLSGILAMHHGSISRDIREWVEDNLYLGHLKAVVCTSSLDLGVDFRPVDTVIQIGSPKGIARFIQRAGRSGHAPGVASHIYFLPTHALELLDISGLRLAVNKYAVEDRMPYIMSYDVLIQFLCTLAVSDGFYSDTAYPAVIDTFAFQHLSPDEWVEVINFLVNGGKSLQAYNEYKRLTRNDDGLFIIEEAKQKIKHKLSIGTIVSDIMIQIKLVKGKYLGVVEEWFIAQLSVGDTFWFAGQALELVRFKDMIAQVKPSKSSKGKIPSYMGGRLPLSSQLSSVLKEKLYAYKNGIIEDVEIEKIRPLLELQAQRSALPDEASFLIEYFEDKEGFHLVFYPFEGRSVHEGMAALIAKRLSMLYPISFTLAMNDIGFELLSDRKIDVASIINPHLFSTKHLSSDIQSSINAVEMAKRRFRDVARISGLIFTGYPGKIKKDKHIQSSAQLIYDVLTQYEPNHLLLRQTMDEVMTFQLEESRLRKCLDKICQQKFVITYPPKATPFSFPLIVDRLREKLSSERLEDRIKKMTLDLEK